MKKIFSLVMICAITLTLAQAVVTNNDALAATQPNKVLKLFKKKTLPKSEKEMRKYLVSVKLPVLVESNKKTKISIKFNNKKYYLKKTTRKTLVHKKLKKKYLNAFKAMVKAKFPINQCACYCWRLRRGSNSLSTHSYGIAMDINPSANGGDYYQNNKNSIYCITRDAKTKNKIVNIWKKQGFYWGGNWKSPKTPMHFSYSNY